MPNSETLVSLPPALVAEVQTIADDEHRPVADVLRDLVALADDADDLKQRYGV
jgi:hypothetical protein